MPSFKIILALLVVVVVIILGPSGASARIPCKSDPCKGIQCSPVHCGGDEIERPGSCGCCSYCAKIIPKGHRCLNIVGGPSPPASICVLGTRCKNGTCQ